MSCLTEYRKGGQYLTDMKTKKLELTDANKLSDNYKSIIDIKDYDYTNYFKNRCLIRSLNTYIESIEKYKTETELAEQEELNIRNQLDVIMDEENEGCNNKLRGLERV